MERHDLDPVSLIFGILFLGLASTALFDNIDLTPLEARWVWPAILIVAGALVLASSVKGAQTEGSSAELGAEPAVGDDDAH